MTENLQMEKWKKFWRNLMVGNNLIEKIIKKKTSHPKPLGIPRQHHWNILPFATTYFYFLLSSLPRNRSVLGTTGWMHETGPVLRNEDVENGSNQQGGRQQCRRVSSVWFCPLISPQIESKRCNIINLDCITGKQQDLGQRRIQINFPVYLAGCALCRLN